MDCSQAQIAMMEHMEKTIQSAQARDLAAHVLECESCREYYIGFDMALEVLDDAELSVPPADFTQAVMSEVCKLPAHTPAEPVATASVALRVLWGLSAIFLGVGLLFAFNPEWLSAVTDASPIVQSILGGMSTAMQYVSGLVESLVSSYQGANGSELSMTSVAIIFIAIMGVLLAVLQRSEKSHNS